jgi:site-specific DNA-methyltransferase (adenine-specific)
MIEMLNCDCMDYMRGLPDKAYDLAIVDPPYGIGENWKKDPHSPRYRHNSTYKNKNIPDKKYFSELFRVSKNQIIWGGNYYTKYLEPRNSWLVWDKMRSFDVQHMAEGELAWTSFNEPLQFIRLLWNGACVCEKRYGTHPHEKPVALYKWLLSRYAKPGDRIIDTHGGSGSICIACHDLGYDLTWMELDKDYYDAACERYKRHAAQAMLFEPKELTRETKIQEPSLLKEWRMGR